MTNAYAELLTLPRFWSKVVQDGDCWTWTGGRSLGYGMFWWQGKVHGAHRLIYKAMRAEFHPLLVIDHLCRNRACVNPYHMEPVTHTVNARRSPLVWRGGPRIQYRRPQRRGGVM